MDDDRRALVVGTLLAALSAFIVTNLTGDFGVSEARYWLILAVASIVLRLSREAKRGQRSPLDLVRSPRCDSLSVPPVNRYLFYCHDSNENLPTRIGIPDQYSCVFWAPGTGGMIPPGVARERFMMLWLMNRVGLFSNDDYGMLCIFRQGLVVHHAGVFPRYFRFPFMSRDDLNIGYIWTHPGHRGQNLASFAIQQIIEAKGKAGRRFWYVVEEGNISSIRAGEKAGMICVGRGIRSNRLGIRALGAYVMNGHGSYEQ